MREVCEREGRVERRMSPVESPRSKASPVCVQVASERGDVSTC
jgi:hypothetical protein